MALSSDIVSQFVKLTKDVDRSEKETTVYGTVVEYNEGFYVRIDGSSLLTPISTTTDAIPGERVTVRIKNHTATVTGNISSPSARTDDLKDLGTTVEEQGTKISEFEIIISDKVTTDELDAEKGRIDDLITETVIIEEALNANSGYIETLQTDYVTVDQQLNAQAASITRLQTDKLDASIADITYATIEGLEAVEVDVYNLTSTYAEFADLTTHNFTAVDADILRLETNKLSAEDIEGKYANIDFSNIDKAAMEYFYSNSGLIENVIVGDGVITGDLVGVTISGDLIKGETIIADKLVIQGNDGLYYKLNTSGMSVLEDDQTLYNSLDGSIIIANSITASKINVDDLVAFDATIGGFNITDNSIYSGVKETVDNTTRGLYLDSDGQMSIGDASNFIKYHKDTDGNYKLNISAESISFGASQRSVEEAIDNIKVGGRNLLLNTGGNELVVMTNGGVQSTSTGSVTAHNDDGVLTIEATTTGLEVYYRFMTPSTSTNNLYGLEPGAQYVFSGQAQMITTSGTPTSLNARIQNYIPGSGWFGDTMSVITTKDTSDWVKFTSMFTVDESATGCYVSVQLYYSGSWEGTIKLKELKLEKGTIPTDWSLAPEDQSTNENVQEAIREFEIGSRNLLLNSKAFAGSNVTGFATVSDEIYNDFVVRQYDASESTSDYTDIITFKDIYPERLGESFTLSFYAKGNGKLTTYFHGDTNYVRNAKTVQSNGIITNLSDGGSDWQLTDTWTRYWVTWTLRTEGDITVSKWVLFRLFGTGIANVCGVKLEKGEKATDWTPAPEDLATAEEFDETRSMIEHADEKITMAESLIQQLSDSISMLVTDGNGTSLMTQTESGWTFSTAEIHTAINAASEGLNDLTHELGDVTHLVDVVQQAVNDLGVIAEYVKVGTYEGEPCIELGESDSDFKLLITNTRIMFMEGSGVPAYINNQSLYINKAVVEEELQQGGFVWKARSNGNLGLVWKGVSS